MLRMLSVMNISIFVDVNYLSSIIPIFNPLMLGWNMHMPRSLHFY